MSRTRRFRKRWLFIAPLVLLVVAATGFAVWASMSVGDPMPEARAALRSDATVRVETGRWLVFRPTDREPEAGFVFYPGARVPAKAYAPMAREVARAGYLAVIAPAPLNLAILDSDEAAGVIGAYPRVEHWAVGGHSLGGVAAAGFAHDDPGAVEGLVLLASYPQGSDDLSERGDLAVASVYGTRDGLASTRDVAGSARLLPADADLIAVDGGNHAGFGWYGPQPGDGAATIGREEQQAQTVAAILGVMEEIERGADGVEGSMQAPYGRAHSIK